MSGNQHHHHQQQHHPQQHGFSSHQPQAHHQHQHQHHQLPPPTVATIGALHPTAPHPGVRLHGPFLSQVITPQISPQYSPQLQASPYRQEDHRFKRHRIYGIRGDEEDESEKIRQPPPLGAPAMPDASSAGGLPPSAAAQLIMSGAVSGGADSHLGHSRQLAQAGGFPLSPMLERDDERQQQMPHHANQSQQQQQQQQHRLPPQLSACYHDARSSAESLSPPGMPGAPSVVGQPGMPSPAPRPKGPKLKFTPTEDNLLIELKENKNLTWKQIADFFPGRTSGTLQVRYCTKLKAKATVWTDDAIHRLRTALEEYENDRWRLIAIKVGNGFSPTACREKAAELDGVICPGGEQQHDDTSSQ